ncbi:MAG: hypothetical protein ACUVRF_11430 [Desulfotomaculales bacterium]
MIDDVLILRDGLLAAARKARARGRKTPPAVLVCRLVEGMERRDPENADLYRRAGLQAVMLLRKGGGECTHSQPPGPRP